MSRPKTQEELQEDALLCEHCPIPKDAQGVHCYGGEPVMCEGSHCDEAYDNYLDAYNCGDAEGVEEDE